MDTHALFTALQLGDSFFPSGMFTQSHGLERFIERGAHGASQLGPLLASYLLAAGQTEGLAARLTCRAARAADLDAIAAIDARLEATKLASEPRAASKRCGGRILLLGADVFGGEVLRTYAARTAERRVPGHQTVALALCAAACGLDEDAAVAVELHGLATSIVSAAIRLGALDHIAGQRLLLGARSAIAEAARAGGVVADIGFAAPEIELMQLQHPGGQSHLFVS